ncbi:hypothetical protein E1258_16750 [Micromonospora sp. KC207]|uniref:hypothetical protein n=1 Tax=Micromonospora sp. KC207 TaxID=2530377 RepID=UPI001046527D|nr:hypothetical protein [Micromonospora sp. KC207]TDC59804.1 hypothetical protein E1258_16750 [Micromonospora sp. KC207]
MPARESATSTSPPKAGDLVQVTRAASVQFVEPIMCRVIRVLDWITYDRWMWLDVYQLDDKGEAVARRSIFVQPAGLRATPVGARLTTADPVSVIPHDQGDPAS